MSHTTATADTLRWLTDEALKVIASFTSITLSDLRESWAARLADLVNQAHELALCENEKRWAESQVRDLDEELGGAVADLAVQVVRNYRRSAYDIRVSHYHRYGAAASRELYTEYGYQVNRDQDGDGWVIELVR